MSQSPSLPADHAPPRCSDDLTARQAECLRLAGEGLSSRQIARRLGVSARTVDDHILLGCRWLGVRTRVQAVALLAKNDRRASEPRSFTP
ncbi:helix-turn-helix transcriptional regulator [Brevundimonas sp.]|uniref:helix-turn-helix transcriptional regulator n=1 Tax=Brevundimonas sp. TaxID=1871086 RepID=UPI0028B184EA|nr:helix-turn-helix transcriptional regulator [Brevundimonas sp.]